MLTVFPAQAQLLSPGELSRVHEELEGVRNCTSCHALRKKGVDAGKCLSCHEPLQTRINSGKGFHATVSRDCGTCHKEHYGADFQLVRLDEARFDHKQTGFLLTGAHREASCRSCHRPELITDAQVRRAKSRHDALKRTFLGLDTTCMSCHAASSPHQGQFSGEDCADCHATEAWENAVRFDHDDTRFALVGRHRQVACAGCHPQATAPGGARFIQFEGIRAANCSSCHRDAHDGAFGTDCQQCHRPGGWNQVRNFTENSFDHSRTGFDLIGAHAALSCQNCHGGRNDDLISIAFVRGTERHTYPRIEAEACQSCHIDLHAGAFADAPGGVTCTNCHTQSAWTPVTYDLQRHNTETAFPLAGAHLATPCTACHGGEQPTFTFEDQTCLGCHVADNPHGDQFAAEDGTIACTACHTMEGWQPAANFNHAQTAYPLTGRHAEVACGECHEAAPNSSVQFRGVPADCASCHADPHNAQFAEATCERCHTTTGFEHAAATFDHRRTRFPLTGAHQQATCSACHRLEATSDGLSFVRYRPLGTACKDCHSG